jgi:hypothetical protein
MRRDNLPIIAEHRGGALPRRAAAAVLILATTIGSAALVFYARRDLTMSHYDARAHVMVARRITDNLTPGWRQIGAVWLPLPHLLAAGPVRSDWAYRTGYASAALSVLSLAGGLSLLAWFIARRTGSAAAAVAAPAVTLLNPNVLYLQSTPMTEPLLIGLACASLAAVDRYLETRTVQAHRSAGISIAALSWTRYEGWCIAGALVALAVVAAGPGRRRGAIGLGAWWLSALGAFLLLGWGATGQWFVASGFFVPENPAFHQPWAAARQVIEATGELGGSVVLVAGVIGAAACLAGARNLLPALLPLALLAAAALPWFAFYQGHPLRVRYMVPLVVAAGVLSAWAIAWLPRRMRPWAAALLVVAAMADRPPFDETARMVTEAQWETPFRRERQSVTAFLARHHDGSPILASMGSLGHYMQEAAWAGFDIADFVHEGNGDLWMEASEAPGRFVNWVLVEERAEGGDALAARIRATPALVGGFERAVEGGGLVLYRRVHPGLDEPKPPVSSER